MICRGVTNIDFEGTKTPVDFVFWDIGHGIVKLESLGHAIVKLERKHLDDFRIWKKYGNRGSEQNNISFFVNNTETDDLSNYPIDFEFVMKLLKQTINKKGVKGKYTEQNQGIEYFDRETGWRAVFAARDGGKRLELMTFYNRYIPDEYKTTNNVDGSMLLKAQLNKIQKSIKVPTIGTEIRINFDDVLKSEKGIAPLQIGDIKEFGNERFQKTKEGWVRLNDFQ